MLRDLEREPAREPGAALVERDLVVAQIRGGDRPRAEARVLEHARDDADRRVAFHRDDEPRFAHRLEERGVAGAVLDREAIGAAGDRVRDGALERAEPLGPRRDRLAVAEDEADRAHVALRTATSNRS